MGIFGRNYNKPGPGVPKDTPRKKGAARFIELLFRDLGDLAKLNILFSICALPTITVFFAGSFGYIDFVLAFMLAVLLSFPIGGAMVSYVYYITKMMRDDPSYVWFEFKRKFLENYRQAAFVGMMCTAFIYAQIWLWANMLGSLILGEPGGDLLWFIIALLSVLIFGMITPYIFLHFAYVDLGSFRAVKNSVLMSFGYLPRSFMGAFLGGILWIVFILFWPMSMLFLPLIALFVISICILLCMMWVWPPFEKYFKIEETLLERMEAKEKEQEKI